ncbi:MAG: hypothetical protein PHV59_06440, partial [Victivallales bacterium]|nr:hypothetical protein [Victivallales bacterium]
MIDIKILRETPELIKDACRRRGDAVDIDAIIALDVKNRELLQEAESLRAERNRLSKECRDNPDAREQVRELKNKLAGLESEQEKINGELNDKLAWLPNLLADDVPDGASDEQNLELRRVGTVPEFNFKPRDHQELGEILDIIDTQRGAKVAQAGFYYWKGKGAQLCNALFYWTQRELINRGFTSFFTPCVAKERTLFGTGYLPFFASQTYALKDEDLALIGTSEQTLVAYHADEILDAADLALKYCAFSPCFRTEAGSYGKASRGIFRVHQFHKVEQIVFCKPEDSPKYHELCLENEEYLLQQLGLPYR